MAQRVEDLTIGYEEDGVQVVEELDKEVLTKGAWATVLFKYRQIDRASGQFGKPQFSIRRFRKTGGEYRVQSKFTISSEDQARKIVDTLTRWMDDAG